MQAIGNERFGGPDGLHLLAADVPALEADGVLVRVRAASLNPVDWHLMRGEPRLFRPMMGGLRGPATRIRGRDVAGVVEAVGAEVRTLAPGDEVFGVANGALAEIAASDAGSLAGKPAGLRFVEAAALPVAGVTALQALRDHGRVGEGTRVLVNGASGGVGTFSVQIAKALGAEVTAVCSARNAELVRSLGADRVVDYATEDFSRGGERYDVLLDNVGNRSLRALRRAVTADGTVVVVGGGSGRLIGPVKNMLGTIVVGRFVRQSLRFFIAKITTTELRGLAELVEAGSVRPVIDGVVPLAATPEAMRYLETGRARGKVIVEL